MGWIVMLMVVGIALHEWGWFNGARAQQGVCGMVGHGRGIKAVFYRRGR